MKQYWLVIPIDMKTDTRAPFINFHAPVVPGAPEENVPDGGLGAQLNAVIQDFEQQPMQPAGRRVQRPEPARNRPQRDQFGNPVGTTYGFRLARETAKEIDNCFETPELAEQYASECAKKHPGKQYGVFTCIRVFETMDAPVITKKFTDAGELALDGDAE